MSDVSILMGRTLSAVERTNAHGEDQIIFTLDDGSSYRMFHSQNCCENVGIDDINGDLNDLVGSPLTLAEEASNVNEAELERPDDQDSHTWTFYRFATVKGYVDIRWYGSSNGYYSERVDFEQIC